MLVEASTNANDKKIYMLKDKGEVVYIGLTSDPKARALQHQLEGKSFTRLEVVSGVLSENEAREREAELISSYMKLHNGNCPMYNIQVG